MDGDFRLASWLVRPSLNSVFRNGTTAQLEPKVMAVLVCLAAHAPEPVPKEKLLQEVWPDTFVGDGVLSRSIFELRRVFEDDAKEPHVIQTIAKRGYQLVAPVEWGNGKTPETAPTSVRTSESGGRTRPMWKAFAAGGVLAVALLLGLIAATFGDLRDRLFSGKAAPPIQSLAVLPLVNLSGDPEQEYFADGMTEELITELSRLSGMKVISRTSVMRYKNSNKSLPEIAYELHVDGIVEGSVMRSGDRVRITAQLIYARTDANLWAETYDRDSRDVFALQAAVAGAIAGKIKMRMIPIGAIQSKIPHTVNLKAHEAYLQGAYHLSRLGHGFGDEESTLAIASLQQAIAEDPDFAAAYVKLCQAYEFQHALFLGTATHSSEKAAAEKALSLDPDSADAHFAVASVKFSEWDFPGAAAELRRALQLNPNHGDAHEWLADYLDVTGQMEEGMRERQLAQEVDPVNDHIANGLIYRRQYDRGIELLRKHLEFRPDDGILHEQLATLYAQENMGKESIEELQVVCRLFGFKEAAQALGRAYGTSGYRGALREWARQLERAQERRQINRPAFVALAYARLGERDAAFRWLEAAYRDHDDDLIFIGVHPGWDSFRSDLRFKDLLRRVGLPQ